jgi:class 3 adenylate cyclase/CHASE2 domain-containing sensor protein
VKLKPVKLAPALIAVSVIAVVCIVRLPKPEFFDHLERKTYDIRVKSAQRFAPPVATNLGAVFISDDSIAVLNKEYQYGVYWPRHVYGRVLRELATQGARAVAFDILFGELKPLDAAVPVGGGRQAEAAAFIRTLHPGLEPTKFTSEQGEELMLVDSDDYFAWQMKRSGMTLLAAEQGVMPHPLFDTNAVAIGDIFANSDADGVLRRVAAFRLYRRWHPAFKQVESDRGYGVDLSKAKFEPGKIILPRRGAPEPIVVPVDTNNSFEVADFWGNNLPPGIAPKAKAFEYDRVWHMGIVLAAQGLGLDLEHAQIDLDRGRITLNGSNGLKRVIPVDNEGYFYINWELAAIDPRLQQEPFEKLLWQDQTRLAGGSPEGTNEWQNKLVIIGSSTTGNDLTDTGATPLGSKTLLVSGHWNVANSIITGRFVHRASLATELAAIVLMGVLASILTWLLPPLRASLSVLLVATIYVAIAFWLYVLQRYWLPVIMPVIGGLVLSHGALVTWRVVFEQTERRRIKSVFSRIVSPDIVNELLGAEKLSLGGARREATVLFADVRGFTELTDIAHERAAEYVREHKLAGQEAESYYDEVARETLNTVNAYLALVADMVKKHGGTLDKYIGDCVMAFWGAPTANPQHAVACVRAAIEAQRAMFEVNLQRTEENRQREMENQARASAGLPPKPLLATLSLGTGINTGQVTVGLMGSEAHILNYTVFGRDVNLASRLEHESGRGRILISEATYEHLRREDPLLAAKCIPQEAKSVKGFRTAVNNYEVPWQNAGEPENSSRQQP